MCLPQCTFECVLAIIPHRFPSTVTRKSNGSVYHLLGFLHKLFTRCDLILTKVTDIYKHSISKLLKHGHELFNLFDHT